MRNRRSTPCSRPANVKRHAARPIRVCAAHGRPCLPACPSRSNFATRAAAERRSSIWARSPCSAPCAARFICRRCRLRCLPPSLKRWPVVSSPWRHWPASLRPNGGAQAQDGLPPACTLPLFAAKTCHAWRSVPIRPAATSATAHATCTSGSAQTGRVATSIPPSTRSRAAARRSCCSAAASIR